MIKIKKSYFKALDGNRYFRRNALSVEVGSHGEKKVPWTEANYLAVKGHIKYDLLNGKIREGLPVKVDWERETKADVGADIKSYFDVGGKADFSYKKAKEANLELVRFHIDENPLKRLLNNDANKVRKAMKKEGKDARVCSSIWVVMSGQLAERFSTSVALEVSGTTSQGLSITAKGGATWSGSETISFTSNAVFAYGLHKVKKWDGDKIGEMELDWHGVN